MDISRSLSTPGILRSLQQTFERFKEAVNRPEREKDDETSARTRDSVTLSEEAQQEQTGRRRAAAQNNSARSTRPLSQASFKDASIEAPEVKKQTAPETGETKETQSAYKSGFVKNYMDSRQIDERIMQLAGKYPDLVKVTTREYGTSGYDGKEGSLRGPAPLRYVTVSSGKDDNGSKPGVLLTAAPHGGEKMNPIAMVELMEQLCANYKPGSNDPGSREITNLIDSMNIYVAPVTNPDGLNYSMYDMDKENEKNKDTFGWRKTRTPNVENDSCDKGVDINRNYGYKWSPYPEETTEEAFKKQIPRRTMYEGYSGPHPFSEPESRHIAGILEEHPEIKFAVDFHSSGEKVMSPTGIKNDHDREIFDTLQKRMIDGIGKPQGNRYKPQESYNYAGNLDDYLYNVKGVYALVVESGKENSPKVSDALNVAGSVTAGTIEMLKAALEIWKKESARKTSQKEAA